jgi:hypothetical protein
MHFSCLDIYFSEPTLEPKLGEGEGTKIGWHHDTELNDTAQKGK